MPEREGQRICTQNIMSGDYGDFIVDYGLSESEAGMPSTYCSQVVNSRYVSFYVPREEWEPLSYSRIPEFAGPRS